MKPLRGAKKAAWAAFALWVKKRDALKTTGTTDTCRCYTCGKVYPIKEIDAGHAIPGRHEAVLFDEEIVYGQCQTCNRWNNGEQQAFRILLTELHGGEWWEEKQALKHKVMQRADPDYKEIAKTYREKLKDLLWVEK
jgi:hypothetical protein